MILSVYSLYDAKAGYYNPPILLHNDQVALRVVSDWLSDGSVIQKHPEDFIFFKLGAFDDQTAQYTLFPAPQVLYRLHEIQLPLSFAAVKPGDTFNDGVSVHRVVTEL